MECKVNDIIYLGDNGGAGNLIICEIKLIHISKHILDTHNKIDPNKIQLVGRLGENWYCDAFDNSLFEINTPTRNIGIGFEQIPDIIKKSNILTKNNLAKLASITKLPSQKDINIFKQHNDIQLITQRDNHKEKLHIKAQMYINQDDIESAWKCLLIDKLN